MNNLLKMEKYQLSHNIFYWCGLIGIFLIGFFTADTYVPEAMGPMGGAATSLADIFNGMVYDSTFLLIIISSILALILGQEFSSRTIDLEVNAGHSRKTIFFAKVISYLIAFNIMALVYPVAGCIRESVRFGITEAGNLCYQVSKAILYSLLLNSATFLIAIWIVFWLRSSARAIAVTALVTFVLSLYLGYGMMFDLPVAFLAMLARIDRGSAQRCGSVLQATYFLPWAILVGVVWIVALITFSWISFRKCELK